MSPHDIAELIGSSHDNVRKTVRALATKGVASSNDTPYKVTALKHDPEASIQRAAFDPMVSPKVLVRLAELLQETM
ncbi:hypothetical protein D3C71_2022910 [compost metagenome]